MSDDMKTPPLTTPNGNVEFTIGGHAFQVQFLSLLDAQRAKPQLMRVWGGAPDWMAAAEQVIDVLCVLLPQLKYDVTKDVLMLACSIGEALKLVGSMNELMLKSGMPMVERPREAEAAPAPAVWHPDPVDDLAIPPRPVATQEQAVITNFPSAGAGRPKECVLCYRPDQVSLPCPS